MIQDSNKGGQQVGPKMYGENASSEKDNGSGKKEN